MATNINLSNGLSIPAVGLGTWKANDEEVYAAVRHALQVGYRHIDCAPIYMNEKPVGRAINDALQKFNIARSEVWITSKLWNSFHDPDEVMPALKETLHFMGLEYLDLYLMHWPVATRASLGYARPQTAADFISLEEIPLLHTWQALEAVHKEGLVRSIGVSNFSIMNLTTLLSSAVKPLVNQVECHPYLTQTELKVFCDQNDIHMTAYSPLGSADRIAAMKAENEPSLLENTHVVDMAQRYGCSAAQLLIAWSLAHGRSVIPKSSHAERIEQNLRASEISIMAEDIASLDRLNHDFRYISGHFFELEGSPYSAQALWN